MQGGSSLVDAVDIGMAEEEEEEDGLHTMTDSSLGLKHAQKFLVIICIKGTSQVSV